MRKTLTDKILFACIGIVAITTMLWLTKIQFGKPSIAYIDIGKLVDNYQLKKDLEKGSEQNLNKIKNRIDSLKMVKQLAGSNGASIDSQLSYSEYVFQDYYVRSNQDITKKIWERLNPVIEQYGKEMGLEMLVGANGQGTLLYGNKRRDMTDNLIKYVNAKYEKGN